jgi:hypothetical protein
MTFNPLLEACFKDTVRAALCDLREEYNIGTSEPDRFSNDATQFIYVEMRVVSRKGADVHCNFGRVERLATANELNILHVRRSILQPSTRRVVEEWTGRIIDVFMPARHGDRKFSFVSATTQAKGTEITSALYKYTKKETVPTL